jgi:hypothetical protein
MGVATFLGQPTPQPNDAGDLIQSTSRSGWVVYEEQITNPTSRPFKIWVSLQSLPGSLKLISYLSEPRFHTIYGFPEPIFFPFYHHSVADLEVGELVVTHQDKKVDLLSLQPGSWDEITLEPNETMLLQWKAQPSSYVNPCSLPPTLHQTFTWKVNIESDPIGFFGEIKVLYPERSQLRSKAYTITWSFGGGEIKGTWDREIRLTHPFVSKADATRSTSVNEGVSPPPEFMVLFHGTIATQIGMGIIPGASESFTCQGMFR